MMNAFATQTLTTPAAIASLLVAVTVLLAVALLLQTLVRRSAAACHAILLSALVAVGVMPIAFLISQWWGLAQVIEIPLPAAAEVWTPANDSTHHAAEPLAASQRRSAVPVGDLLFVVWLIGMAIGLVRIGHGLWVIGRLRRRATPIVTTEKSIAALSALTDVLDEFPPTVFVSGQVAVPMTVGLWRPVVILPRDLVERLDQRQLTHVLLHECAHARRRDPLVGLYQRLVAAVLWFHPLVHVANRLLDDAREQLCDNFTLRAALPTDYTQTLLSVARSLLALPVPPLAATLFSSRRRLERRVARLLTPRRNIMTRLSTWKTATIAGAFLAGGFVLTCLAAPESERSEGYDLSHEVKFEVGATYLVDGDSITIEQIHGTTSTVTPGNLYIIKGKYRLTSADRATLACYTTTSERRAIPTQRTQKMEIERGEGRFSLIHYMWCEGNPHLSFYPAEGGSSFASVYFGTDETLLKRGWWEPKDAEPE